MFVANFVAGVLVGVLLGLALAPVVRAWVLWKTVAEARRSMSDQPDEVHARIDT